jgi:mannosyltransferase OCH1-like enzyme
LASIIPKKLHLIWVGDDGSRPDRWIESWRTNHPHWEFRLWGNAERETVPWRCAYQIQLLAAAGRWDGVADVMRYEILHEHGGVYVDADSLSVRPLDDWLLETPMFAVWESEEHAPGLVANGFIGAIAGHAALVEIVDRIRQLKDPLRVRNPWRLWPKRVAPWKTVGPVLFTEVVRGQPPDQVKILASELFLPRHFLDAHERQGKVVYARHFWQTTNKDRGSQTAG